MKKNIQSNEDFMILMSKSIIELRKQLLDSIELSKKVDKEVFKRILKLEKNKQ